MLGKPKEEKKILGLVPVVKRVIDTRYLEAKIEGC